VRSRIRLIALIATFLSVTAAVATADPKDRVGAKRAAAASAHARADALRAQVEPAIEAYNQAAVQLAAVMAQVKANRRAIAVVKTNIARSQADLASKLAMQFRSGDPDVTAALLSASSLDQMLSQLDVMKRSQSQLASLIGSLRTDQLSLKRTQAALAKARSRARDLTARRAAQAASIRQSLAAANSLEAGYKAEIQQLLSAQASLDAKRARDAQARQAALDAAARANANNDPGLGGSGGSGGGHIPPPPVDGSIASRVVAKAYSFLGIPYVWGGASLSGMDCSGLTMLAYASVGISLAHYTGDQWGAGPHVSRDQLAPGDLVFFGSDLHHVGLYIGGGQFIEAPHTGANVRIATLSERYDYVGAVRPY
jgi:cell wall-associated NlpC family hydrolase